MKVNPHDDQEPLLDDSDPVWRLLARAPRPEPDAWFTVRTLARCRHVGLVAESRGISFNRMWRWALGGGLSFCLALFIVMPHIHFHSASSRHQKNVQEAFEIMASLGTDSDSSSWQDSSL